MVKPYTLPQIADILQGTLVQDADPADIADLSIDSRKIAHPGQTLFLALKGTSLDGHSYIAELTRKGVANFVISDKSAMLPNANFILVKDVRAALQKLAAYHRKQFA